MKLSTKTFLYSAALGLCVLILIVGYTLFMLPSLYVDNKLDANRNKIIATHNKFLKSGSLESAENSIMSSITMIISKDTHKVQIYHNMFNAKVRFKDSEAISIFDRLTALLKDYDLSESEKEKLGKDVDKLLRNISKDLTKTVANKWFDLDFQANPYNINPNSFTTGTTDVKSLGKNTILTETSVYDDENQYSNLIIVTNRDNEFVLSFSSVVAPRIEDVKQAVINSLPMILAVLLLTILIISRVFSNTIVKPITKMANFTQRIQNSSELVKPLNISTKDELEDLSVALNEFYALQRAKYRKLEEENKRREVFVKASSHQLKTPVAAAMLLTEGMIGKVGKFSETELYLPEVKKQLITMQKIIDEILKLNKVDPRIISIDTKGVVNQILQANEIGINSKGIKVYIKGEGKIKCDLELFEKMLDNLIVNAIEHSSAEGEIHISIKDKSIEIYNEKAHIDELLLPNIKEPFVTSANVKSGNGLGLYVVDFYAQLTHLDFSIANKSIGVLTILKEASF